MGWLVVALGGLLSVVGAMAIYFGWDIVRDERGWTQVISGSVGVSGGVVTMALGLVVSKLAGLRRDLRAALRQGVSPPVATQKTDEGVVPQPSLLASHASPGEETVEAEGPEPPKPPERKRRKDVFGKLGRGRETPRRDATAVDAAEEAATAHATAETTTPVTASFAPTLDSGAIVASVAGTGMASADDLTAAAVVTADQGAEPHDPAVRHPETATAAGLAVVDEPVVEEPAVEKPAASEPALEDQPDQAQWATAAKSQSFSYDRFEQELARLDQVETAALEAPPPDREPAKAAAATERSSAPIREAPPAEPQPAAPKSAVVGQYEAGGVSYVMYADGSIEADTPNGVYRFSDINELKAFIQSHGAS